MNGLQTTSVSHEGLRGKFDLQRKAFRRHAPLSHAKRIEALNGLLNLVLRNEKELIAAIHSDFSGRSANETRALEIFPLVHEIRYTRRNLRGWMRTRSVSANWHFFPSSARVQYQPLGVVGILGAYNYPLLLALSPMIGALSAGNHVMLKPSEVAPATARLIASIIAEVFPEEYVTAVEGGPDVAAQFSALPFDHLLYTGSSRVGKLVMKAAAENLTPVTLELGGKSPALVHGTFPMALAADRICAAKFWNSGQTCVAPDYVLIPEGRVEEFLRACERSVRKRFSDPESNPDYTRMIGSAPWRRMVELVEDARAQGAQILTVGESQKVDGFMFPPTLVAGVAPSMRVMQEEIFGPVLPIAAYTSLDQALDEIADRPRPLALYYFDRNAARIRHVLERTVSGGVTINDCIFHLAQLNLPFGGVGASGMGAYRGFDGFTTFSKKKGVLLEHPFVGAFFDRFFKPPYSSFSQRLLSQLIGAGKTQPLKRIALEEKPPFPIL